MLRVIEILELPYLHAPPRRDLLYRYVRSNKICATDDVSDTIEVNSWCCELNF